MIHSMQYLASRSASRRISQRNRFVYLSLLLLALCGLTGCNVGPKYLRPVVPSPPAFKEVDTQQAGNGSTWKTAKPQDGTLRGKWWEIYQEPELNALEDKLNVSNQNIAQSYDDFMAARAQVQQARSSYYPTIGVGPSYARNRSSQSQGAASSLSSANPNSNVFNLPFDVSWEPISGAVSVTQSANSPMRHR
jgi:outer membrane protein TolC